MKFEVSETRKIVPAAQTVMTILLVLVRLGVRVETLEPVYISGTGTMVS